MFNSVMESVTSTLSMETALVCTAVSLIIGLLIAITYLIQGGHSRNYIISLVILPAMVQAVIMLVNGNLGTSVAVMGAFSLIRFRSLPGNSREIIGIFFAMVAGLATGMGYLSYAVLMTFLVCLVMLLLYKSPFARENPGLKNLKIIIPENLDYTEVFTDLFQKYTKSSVLDSVKTTNMGSMYELRYQIILKKSEEEKKFIDELRCRNGNLTIVCGRTILGNMEL